ncbi:MAG: PSD1 domain-containing protein [Planctomycetes bacterium]|nr:PSD1 domain-containing protein [Planctomycetota bacterium]MCB9917257.1 PSD1 domain-containing protein [Planctomycetota bacterium]
MARRCLGSSTSVGLACSLIAGFAALSATSQDAKPHLQAVSGGADVTFSRDVAPILDRYCVRCHGPARQRKSLRLDSPHSIVRGGRGGPAIAAGDSGHSLLMRRIEGTLGKRMPPEGPRPSDAELRVLRAWIDDGARYVEGQAVLDTRHWAFRPLTQPEVPEAPEGVSARHPIDRFLARMQQHRGLEVAPRADAETLLRRLSLDLRGLPSSEDERTEFLAAIERDGFDAAWQTLVDRFLEDPATAEHRAAQWLDLARYADTKGYEADRRRTMWPWRDWVIRAFKADMPFDRFTELQLAGDLMDAGREGRLATAFHRNTMTNDEGGTDDEEFRVAAVHDRVATTFSVWFGLTMECARCHDHKYDPISQREYYELFAFFDQTQDRDRNDDAPLLAVPRDDAESRKLDRLEAEVAEAAEALGKASQAADAHAGQVEIAIENATRAFAATPPQLGSWELSGPAELGRFAESREGDADERPAEGLLTLAEARAVATEVVSGRTVSQLRASARAATSTPVGADGASSWTDGTVHRLDGPQTVWLLERTIHVDGPLRAAVRLGSDDAFAVFVDGERLAGRYVERAAVLGDERVPIELTAGDHRLALVIVNVGGIGGFAFELAPHDFDAAENAALAKPRDERTPGEERLLAAALRRQDNGVRVASARLVAAEARLEALHRELPRVPILAELGLEARRTTHVHRRGSFLDPGAVVTSATPSCLHAMPTGAPRDRLGLARWIASSANPLTPRVIADREWARLFGRGLVRTPEDWGTQGEPPVFPELLEWLASDFSRHRSLRSLTKTIVLSAAYQRASSLRAQDAEDDPENECWARGPRMRLPAETIRDSILAVSGLLSHKRYGPPVMPVQPDGVWSIVYSADRWVTSAGEDRHRRALYTFWRRTSPYPALTIFDAPSREFCVLDRGATNTPLQALVLRNDPFVVEAAQALGTRLAAAHAREFEAGTRALFLTVLGREARPDEVRAVVDACRAELSGRGDLASIEAMWAMVAGAMFGLDEFLTKL